MLRKWKLQQQVVVQLVLNRLKNTTNNENEECPMNKSEIKKWQKEQEKQLKKLEPLMSKQEIKATRKNLEKAASSLEKARREKEIELAALRDVFTYYD
jgi:predicted RNA binding protein with dsRBD fold (UPF0201 family)